MMVVDKLCGVLLFFHPAKKKTFLEIKIKIGGSRGPSLSPLHK
jgi:hypothetical protein